MRVGFACVENAGRSQMAAAFAATEAQERGIESRFEFVSGGTEPAESVHDHVAEAMLEVGIDIRDRRPSQLSRDEIDVLDVVVTMGCSDQEICPKTWRGDSRDWGVADPANKDLDAVRAIRDEIATRVSDLLDELNAPVVNKQVR